MDTLDNFLTELYDGDHDDMLSIIYDSVVARQYEINPPLTQAALEGESEVRFRFSNPERLAGKRVKLVEARTNAVLVEKGDIQLPTEHDGVKQLWVPYEMIERV